MSKYTTTIRDYLMNTISDGYTLSENELVENGVSIFFDFDFPWYTDDEETRIQFEKMYLMFYLTNEIGQETIGLHKQCFRRVIISNVEMLKQKYNLLSTMDSVAGSRVSKHDEKATAKELTNSTSNTTETTTNTQNQQSIHSDNPQVTFSQNDYASEMDRGEYVSNSANSGNSESNNNRDGETERILNEIETDTRNSEKYFNSIDSGVYLINTLLLEKCRKLFLHFW